MREQKTADLLVAMSEEARILRAAAALMDGRSFGAKHNRKLADLLDGAVMLIQGMQLRSREQP